MLSSGRLKLFNPETISKMRRASLVDYVTAGVGLALWRLFFPGLMSQDSVIQYGQAITGHYNDWQPPLMALAIKIVLGLGGALGS